ncbi:MAG: hypothetical protein K1X94_07220 [Sandaracinaceae bacterium]|jgi:hypothetical protein|nr:hypothetical protein [Sandaracinaceae bacterium]
MRVLYSDADNVFVSEGSLVVQIRRGTMTHQTLDLVDKHVLDPRSHPTALMVVFEESAVVPPADVRKRQQALVKQVLAREGVHVAIVILASGIMGTMLRTISRTMSLTVWRTSTFASIEAAARWLTPSAGLAAPTIVDTAERARRERAAQRT